MARRVIKAGGVTVPVVNACVACGKLAMFGGGAFRNSAGTWYCADHFWQSPHGVAMAMNMQSVANEGADNDQSPA